MTSKPTTFAKTLPTHAKRTVIYGFVGATVYASLAHGGAIGHTTAATVDHTITPAADLLGSGIADAVAAAAAQMPHGTTTTKASK